MAAALVAWLLLLPVGRADAAPQPSWRCVGGVCLGQSRAAIAYRFGGIVDEIPSRSLRVPGGRVSACFWRCEGAATEDGFTYYGGTQRPANRVLGITTCAPIFHLPDGVSWGTRIPFGDRWNGYRRINLFEPGPRPGWEKIVRAGKSRVRIVLDMTEGRVRCLALELG